MIKGLYLAAAAGIAFAAPASAAIVDLRFAISAYQDGIGAVMDGNFHITFDNTDSFGPTTHGISFVGVSYGDGPFKMAYDADADQLQIGNALENWDNPGRNSTYYTIEPLSLFTPEGIEEGNVGTYAAYFLHLDPEGDYWDLKGGQPDIRFLSGPVPGVPEPTMWALMTGGFGMIGSAIRKRRQTRIRFV